ncbi:ubiquitin carboxyl-terminal hydrolase 10-like [Coccinella septempunctata]|uniref:ubiquitin carboxyl-terminal hydrolase 10-like n=1 Tax=Coccinella septempunctata TaxID=41139 RepID=UPI001D068911|nr:ubiquitin carboxyl-terminal hydrolase 10-like [Coccinella septempunctata]XP_044760330.1 ubiquitin carboxyl-terminal hydrolase 10-like [Coccinella septempunctata]XP_044760581.1 ubiquitin carboxyl-terminal hydrolase 10-like [Coccinella septempunctata]
MNFQVMDNMQFLDITGLEVDEIRHINSCLSDTPQRISLPWTLKKKSPQKKLHRKPNAAVECKKPSDVDEETLISYDNAISVDTPTSKTDHFIPTQVSTTADKETVPSNEIAEELRNSPSAPISNLIESNTEVMPVKVENIVATSSNKTEEMKNKPVKVQTCDVKKNGVKSDVNEPVNVWAKKSWTSLFKKEEPTTNGELVTERSDEKVKSLDTVEKSRTIDPATHRLAEFLSNFEIDGKSANLQPRGLINRSNYCYINSILQALLACPPLCNLLIELSKNLTENGHGLPPIIKNMCKFINNFEKLPDSYLNRISKRNKKKQGSFDFSCGDSIEASSIYTILNDTRSDSFLVEGRQEDAEEFLGLLLNGLKDEMMNIIESCKTENKIEMNHDSEDWKQMGPKNKRNITRKVQFDKTPISDIFGGLLCSKIHKTGDESTENIQPFLTLQLNIRTAKTITEALEQLTIKNQLEGITSAKTNQKVEAWQQVLIEKLPAVLVLHLQCFRYNGNGCTKIMKKVEFPIDLQVDSKILSGKPSSSSEKQYKLFAVVYHEGKEASKGHYVADAFHSGHHTWLRFDDAKVRSVSVESVLKPHGDRVPYLLFYKRGDIV